jgi:hypothetical protein
LAVGVPFVVHGTNTVPPQLGLKKSEIAPKVEFEMRSPKLFSQKGRVWSANSQTVTNVVTFSSTALPTDGYFLQKQIGKVEGVEKVDL